jgi:predicted 2-oxoglutarate/Fe(II)-dependent dioxygenase YbiX
MQNERTQKSKHDKLNWPVLTPKTNLRINNILPNKQLFTVNNFLTTEECKNIIKFAETQLKFVPSEKAPPKRGYAYRDNDRVQVTNHQFANTLWEMGTNSLFTNDGAVGLNPNLRFYKYASGQQFGAHIDESVTVDGKKSKYTMLVYLSGGSDDSGLRGGELVFYKGKNKVVASVAPVIGLLVIHEHGDRCLEHEAKEVLRGVKYVLRSDVMFD